MKQLTDYNLAKRTLLSKKKILISELQCFFDFEIDIIEQASDGTCILNCETSSLLPISYVKEQIKLGKINISSSDFERNSI